VPQSKSEKYFPDSQGTELWFAGFFIGGLIRFSVTPASCSPNDVTHLGAVVWGTAADARVVRAYEPGPVEPGTVQVEVLGSPTVAATDVGMMGELSIGGAWGGVAYPAFLSRVTLNGSVGELVRSSWEFQLT
jgi:hypothetical protein